MVFYTFKQNRFQESLYSTKTYCHSLCNISYLFTSCILSYSSKDKSVLKEAYKITALNPSYSGINQIEQFEYCTHEHNKYC